MALELNGNKGKDRDTDRDTNTSGQFALLVLAILIYVSRRAYTKTCLCTYAVVLGTRSSGSKYTVLGKLRSLDLVCGVSFLSG
jgi:hypothetical protein